MITLCFFIKSGGPWTQLRIIVSDVEILENLPSCDDVCTHCGICKDVCPAKAIKYDTLLGAECNEYQCKNDGYIGIPGSYIFKCEECVRACTIVEIPEKITISKFL